MGPLLGAKEKTPVALEEERPDARGTGEVHKRCSHSAPVAAELRR